MQQTDRHLVVRGEDRRRPARPESPSGDEFRAERIAARRQPVPHERPRHLQPGGLECAPPAALALDRVDRPGRPGEVQDVAVTECDEVVDREPRPLELVDRDAVESRSAAALCGDQGHADPHAVDHVERGVVGHDEHERFDVLAEEHVDRAHHLGPVGRCHARDRHLVAGSSRRLVEGERGARRTVQRGARRDEPDHPRLAGDEGARSGARSVVELSNRRIDPCASDRANGAFVVEHSRDGLVGHARELRDVGDVRHGWPSAYSPRASR